MRRPRFIAEQARHARGPLGRLIAFIMARETWAENKRAIEALALSEGDHVLDVGCGHGRSLGLLAAGAPRGLIVGVDPSDLMAELAAKRNRAAVKAGRVKVMIAAAGDLPFPDASFDKALCAHVIYFWKDMRRSFGEIARVLKPGGHLALVFRSDADQGAVRAFPPDIYYVPALADVKSALERAGFCIDQAAVRGRDAPARPLLLVAVKRA